MSGWRLCVHGAAECLLAVVSVACGSANPLGGVSGGAKSIVVGSADFP